MRGAVFHHEVSSWHCSVLIELYNEGEYYNCQLCTCFRHIVQEKSASSEIDSFSFLSQ